MEAVPEWLNYGAFGLLVAVLIAIGKFLYVQFSASLQQSRDIADRAEARAERMADNWVKVIESNISVNSRVAIAMEALIEQIAESRSDNNKEHREILKEVARKS